MVESGRAGGVRGGGRQGERWEVNGRGVRRGGKNITETDENKHGVQVYCETRGGHLVTATASLECQIMMLLGAKYHQRVNAHHFASISNYSGGVGLIHIGGTVIFISR